MNCKKIALCCVLLVASFCFVGLTFAYLATESDTVTNVFKEGEITFEIEEDFDRMTKSNVAITSTGNTPMYLRVTFALSLQDAQGNTLAQPISLQDFALTGFVASDWIVHEDVYYYKKIVLPGETIPVFDSATVQTTLPEGAFPVFTILADGIQLSAAPEHWHVVCASDGTIESVIA